MTTLQIICTEVPAAESDGKPTEFGLLEGKDLVEGDTAEDGTVRFETEVTVERGRGIGYDFRGPAVNGRPNERFLYLGWRLKEDGAPWMRRWKIKLEGLPTEGTVATKLRADGRVWPKLSGWTPVEETGSESTES